MHECGTARGIGYFLEPLLVISLFGRKVRQWTKHDVSLVHCGMDAGPQKMADGIKGKLQMVS